VSTPATCLSFYFSALFLRSLPQQPLPWAVRPLRFGLRSPSFIIDRASLGLFFFSSTAPLPTLFLSSGSYFQPALNFDSNYLFRVSLSHQLYTVSSSSYQHRRTISHSPVLRASHSSHFLAYLKRPTPAADAPPIMQACGLLLPR
jgi:hypothetical protein